MTLNELIDFALQDITPAQLYEAVDAYGREHTNARGQLMGSTQRETTRIWATLDVFKPILMLRRALTDDERILLDGLKTREQQWTLQGNRLYRECLWLIADAYTQWARHERMLSLNAIMEYVLAIGLA